MCKTRWSKRDVAYERFYLAIPFLAETLEVILGTHADLDQFRSDFPNGWDAKAKKEASSFLNALTTFEFLIGIISLYCLLHPLSPITQKLQGRTADIVYAHNDMQEVADKLNCIRENVDKETDVIYQQALRTAEKLCIEPVIPRTVMRQTHRNNLPVETPLIYYKRALIIPLLDTIISEITIRFKKTHCIADKVLCLAPSIICDGDSPKFQEVVKMYESDLPNPDADPDQELMLWKNILSTID